MVATTVAEPLPEYWVAEIDESGNLIAHYHGEHPMKPCKVFDTEAELKVAYPQIEEAAQRQNTNSQKILIDRDSGVDIAESHSFKYSEAILYTTGAVTDLTKLKYLSDELDRCQALDPAATAQACAETIIAKATENAAAEKQRVTDKSAV